MFPRPISAVSPPYDRGRYVATPSLPWTLWCDMLIKLASEVETLRSRWMP